MNVYNEYLKSRGEATDETGASNGQENINPNGEAGSENKA